MGHQCCACPNLHATSSAARNTPTTTRALRHEQRLRVHLAEVHGAVQVNVVPVDRTGEGIGQNTAAMEPNMMGPGANANVYTSPRMSK